MRCGNCPATFCQYRRADGECVFNSLPNGPWDKGYEPADKSRLRDKESWVTTAKKELECEDLLIEERLKCLKEIREIKDRYAEFVNKVQELRNVQNAHAKTMQYGLRNQAIALGKEVDKMLTEILPTLKTL